jgi:hypothetical protein
MSHSHPAHPGHAPASPPPHALPSREPEHRGDNTE